jgi:hypothetical protein
MSAGGISSWPNWSRSRRGNNGRPLDGALPQGPRFPSGWGELKLHEPVQAVIVPLLPQCACTRVLEDVAQADAGRRGMPRRPSANRNPQRKFAFPSIPPCRDSSGSIPRRSSSIECRNARKNCAWTFAESRSLNLRNYNLKIIFVVHIAGIHGTEYPDRFAVLQKQSDDIPDLCDRILWSIVLKPRSDILGPATIRIGRNR